MKILHYLNKKTILLTLGLCLISISTIKAQFISGPNSMSVGQQSSFSIPVFDPDITWSVSPTSRAQIIGANGGTSVQIRALSTGTFTLNLSLSSGSDSKTVSVSPTPTPAKPSTPSSSVANCAVTLTRSNPPSGVTWYWQTSTGGTSRANASASFSPTSNGTYYLRGRANVTTDIWGPASNGVSVSIPTNPSAPSANVGQPSCAVPTATITITSPTTSGNTYSFNNGSSYQTSPTKSGLAPGNYTLKVKNSVGCVSGGTVYVVQNPPSPPANPTVTIINPTCATPSGTISITGPTTNINGYSFNNGASYQTSSTKASLAPGNYLVKVRTFDGCISGSTTVTIASAPSTPNAPTASKTDPNCTTSTGSISITSPTTSGNTYSFDNGLNYQTSATKSGLAAGTYNLKVKNAAGCVSNGTAITLANAPGTPSAPVANVGQPSCAVPTATITITSPTTSGNTYSFDNGLSYQTSPTKSDLAPGNYTLLVRNSAGCVSDSSVYVVQNPPSPPANPTVTKIDPSCSTPTGTITITGPTTDVNGYSFDNGLSFGTNASQSGLAPGSYTVLVRTFQGCTSGGTTVVIASAPSTPNAPTANKTDPSCTTSTGSITITSPTTSGNTYSFDNGLNYQTSTTKSGLAAGTYTLKVKNSTGCVSNGTAITIANAPSTPSAPIANVGQPSCAVPTATITITSPTTSGNTYSFDNGTSYQSSPTKSDLAPGNYTLLVKNSAGCVSSSSVYVVQNPPSPPANPTATKIDPTCATPTGTITITGPTTDINGYSFDNGLSFGTNASQSGLAPGNYVIKVKTWDGCVSAGTTVSIASGPPLPNTPVATSENSSCIGNTGSITITSPLTSGNLFSFDGGNSYQTSASKSNLSAGTYTLRVRNSAGCTSNSTQITITTAPLPPNAPGFTKVDPSCSATAGSITITNPVQSGNTYSFDDGLTFQTDPSKLDLPSGTYELKVMNSAGCISSATSVTLNGSSFAAQPTLSNVVQPICATALGKFTITNYDAANTYTVSPPAGVEISGSSIFAPAGNYTVTASSGECTSSASEIRNVIAPSDNCETIASGGSNYTYSRSYQQERSTATNFFTEDSELIQQITYYDGLGRPIQQVGIDQSPDVSDTSNYNDIITHVEYDGYGRMDKEFLPYSDPSSDLAIYRGDALSKTSNYYATDKYQNTTNPYSEKHLESSPLNRIFKQAAPGDPWKMNPTGEDHSIEFDYLTNTHDPLNPTDSNNDNVRLFSVDLSGGKESPILSSISTYYSAGQLNKSITRDENHPGTGKDHTTEEFTDRRGRVVLKRTYNQEIAHDTYYVYDEYGNLSFVIPPKVDTSDGVSTMELNELCYQYVYDDLKRLIEKKIPGKGWEYIIYNKLDQPIMTQDANQRVTSEWLYTKYDAFGRVAYTGKSVEVESPGVATSRTDVQDNANSITTTQWVDPSGSYISDGMEVGYDNAAYPNATITEVLTINYYDDYDFDLSSINLTVGNIYDRAISTNVRGLATGSKVKVLDPTASSAQAWITSITQFEDKDRAVRTVIKNDYLGTLDEVKMKIDFVGRALLTRAEHTRNGTTIVTIDNYTYDHAGRLLVQTQCIGDETLGETCDGAGGGVPQILNLTGQIDEDNTAGEQIIVTDGIIIPEPGGDNSTLLNIDPNATGGSGETELIVRNQYDELGRLDNKKVGGEADATDVLNSTGLQTVNYNYNVRDWLTSINDPNAMGNDLFAFDIKYNDVGDPSRRLYNGNISQTVWNSANNALAGNPASRNYVYSYDALNRITGATGLPTSNYNVSGIAYDKNGNIMTLKRDGHTALDGNGLVTAYGVMDDLTYAYTGNQLNSVDDDNLSSATQGFADGSELPTEYTYDENGNMETDTNKGITGITYNHLNLPEQISIAGGTISYVYDATGIKQKKTVSASTVTDYTGNHIYENDKLQMFNTLEGYVAPKNVNDYTAGFDYVYNYTDHLGNIRLSYTDADGNGSINPTNEIVEENNFYPYGMRHQGYNNNISALGNSFAKKFKYQGQELNNSQGYDMFEFELRHYDPAIGRFVTTDPYEQFHSPYLAMGNNPIVSFDPTGGLCYDANGNEIACPDGKDYDQYRDNKDEHINILDEVVLTGKSKETQANEAYWAEINKRAEILNKLATLETGKTSQGRAEEARAAEAPILLVIEMQPPTYSSPFEYIGVGAGLKGLSLLVTRLNQVKSIGLPGLRGLTINMKHILSGHVAGGARVSSLKTLFSSNLSSKQIESMIKTAYKNGKRVKTQGDRIKVVGQAKDGTVIEIWVNKATKVIETAYPLK